MSRFTFILLFLSSLLHAEPTPKRTWTSSAGSKISAVATHIENGQVCLSTDKGRIMLLDLDKLSSSDQGYLKKHFEEDFEEERVWDDRPSSNDSPQGKNSSGSSELERSSVVGPITASAHASYYYYRPTTLPPGGKAPILFWTGSGNAHAGSPIRFARAADLTGTLIVTLKESKTGDKQGEIKDTFRKHLNLVKDCLTHLASTQPVDTNRVFFSGDGGGGALAYYLSSKLPCLGTMSMISYLPKGVTPPKENLYYITGGARDRYRYASSEDAKKLGPRATQVFYLGGHSMGPAKYAENGLTWLYTRHILEQASAHPEEAALYEKRLIQWLTDLALLKSGEATYWTDFILNTCSPGESLHRAVTTIHDRLSEDKRNLEYLAGRNAISAFALKYFASIGGREPQIKHESSRLKKASDKLLTIYDATVGISDIIGELGMETQ